MTRENVKLFGMFLLINLLVVVVFGFDHETITFSNKSSLSELQLLTTHFSHHSWSHLFGNMAGMLILLALFPRQNHKLLIAFFLCILFVGSFVIYANIPVFLGASALLYCVPGCQFAADLNKNHKRAGTILFILCLYLFIMTPLKNIKSDNDWQPMTAAHILGFVAGMTANWLATTRQSILHVKN